MYLKHSNDSSFIFTKSLCITNIVSFVVTHITKKTKYHFVVVLSLKFKVRDQKLDDFFAVDSIEL